jgi:hypothetical protein
MARFAALSRRAGIWHLPVTNALYQMAAFALFTYLAAATMYWCLGLNQSWI